MKAIKCFFLLLSFITAAFNLNAQEILWSKLSVYNGNQFVDHCETVTSLGANGNWIFDDYWNGEYMKIDMNREYNYQVEFEYDPEILKGNWSSYTLEVYFHFDEKWQSKTLEKATKNWRTFQFTVPNSCNTDLEILTRLTSAAGQVFECRYPLIAVNKYAATASPPTTCNKSNFSLANHYSPEEIRNKKSKFWQARQRWKEPKKAVSTKTATKVVGSTADAKPNDKVNSKDSSIEEAQAKKAKEDAWRNEKEQAAQKAAKAEKMQRIEEEQKEPIKAKVIPSTIDQKAKENSKKEEEYLKGKAQKTDNYAIDRTDEKGSKDATPGTGLVQAEGMVDRVLSPLGYTPPNPIIGSGLQIGTVVIEVCVNQYGEVTHSSYSGQESTVSDLPTIKMAIENAKLFKFNRMDTEQKCGTIKYSFRE